MLIRRHPDSHRHEEENPYWVSFSDIMAGLLVIFILALITVMVKLHEQTMLAEQLKEDIESALMDLAQIEELRKQILDEMKNDLKIQHVRVEVVENHTVLRIPDDQLYFERGRHHIPDNRKPLLDIVGEVLQRALTQRNRLNYIDTIFIEGHTDSTPMGKEMGNWGLSSYRAISVWKYWTEAPGKQQGFVGLKNRKGQPVFSVSGYADTRRVEFNESTGVLRRKNRRIDLRFTMLSPEVGDLTRLLERFKNEGY